MSAEKQEETAQAVIGFLSGAASVIEDYPAATSLERAAAVMREAEAKLRAAFTSEEAR
jgi:hypothetical protein